MKLSTRRQLREQAVNYVANIPSDFICKNCAHYKRIIGSCPILPGVVSAQATCDKFTIAVPTEKEVNYKIVGGMRAVVGQCKNCHYSFEYEISKERECVMLHAIVSPRGRCNRYRKEEVEA